jgi:hypothetical protein
MRNAVVILRSTFCSISDAQFAVTASTRHMPALAGAFVSFALVEKHASRVRADQAMYLRGSFGCP